WRCRSCKAGSPRQMKRSAPSPPLRGRGQGEGALFLVGVLVRFMGRRTALSIIPACKIYYRPPANNMAIQLTAEDARQSMQAHVAFKGAEIHEKYGPQIGWEELLRLLEDRTCVRYPCEIQFDSSPLNDNEFAHAEPKGERPE